MTQTVIRFTVIIATAVLLAFYGFTLFTGVIFIWVVIHARKVLDCVWGGIYRWVVKIKGALLISAYGINESN